MKNKIIKKVKSILKKLNSNSVNIIFSNINSYPCLYKPNTREIIFCIENLNSLSQEIQNEQIYYSTIFHFIYTKYPKLCRMNYNKADGLYMTSPFGTAKCIEDIDILYKYIVKIYNIIK